MLNCLSTDGDVDLEGKVYRYIIPEYTCC